MKSSYLVRVGTVSWRVRLLRCIWNVVWMLAYRPTPVFMHRWRTSILKLFGAKISGRVYPYPSVRIWAPWNLEMNSGSCLGPYVTCYNVSVVSLGRDVTVSQRAHLCSASHDFDVWEFPLVVGKIRIGDSSWIAAEAFVGPGVEIGYRAVVLARAVVVRDVTAGVVVGGNPARELRQRALAQGRKDR